MGLGQLAVVGDGQYVIGGKLGIGHHHFLLFKQDQDRSPSHSPYRVTVPEARCHPCQLESPPTNPPSHQPSRNPCPTSVSSSAPPFPTPTPLRTPSPSRRPLWNHRLHPKLQNRNRRRHRRHVPIPTARRALRQSPPTLATPSSTLEFGDAPTTAAAHAPESATGPGEQGGAAARLAVSVAVVVVLGGGR